MIYKKIDLKKTYPVKGGVLEAICADNPWDYGHEEWRRPAVIVVPGGGYWFVSKREGEMVANEFLARGYQVFILHYLCRPQGAFYPEQLVELSCSIDHIRKNSKEYNVNEKEVFALGFSAGGHLVADLSNEYSAVPDIAGIMLDCKPTAAGLSYPVIDRHDESFDNLLFGYEKDVAEKIKKELELNKKVTENTSPTFIWTTSEDNLVPVGNSVRYALALSEQKVPFELHVYPKGWHGLSVCSLEINPDYPTSSISSTWVNDCARFFRDYCEEKY